MQLSDVCCTYKRYLHCWWCLLCNHSASSTLDAHNAIGLGVLKGDTNPFVFIDTNGRSLFIVLGLSSTSISHYTHWPAAWVTYNDTQQQQKDSWSNRVAHIPHNSTLNTTGCSFALLARNCEVL